MQDDLSKLVQRVQVVPVDSTSVLFVIGGALIQRLYPSVSAPLLNPAKYHPSLQETWPILSSQIGVDVVFALMIKTVK
jgi:hypothetical protein